MGDVERDLGGPTGASPDGDRAGGPTDLSHSSVSQPEALIPSAYAPWAGGKCRVPMWCMGCPAGFCDEEAFGEQLPSEILQRERGYNSRYNPIPYCNGPCCPAHGGPRKDEVRFFTDGLTEQGYQMWCAVNPDFTDLQTSPAGFSGNPLEAREKLRAASAMSASGQDAGERLEAKPASAVGAAETPKDARHDQ